MLYNEGMKVKNQKEKHGSVSLLYYHTALDTSIDDIYTMEIMNINIVLA